MLRWYQRKLATHPILTHGITTAFLFEAGDTMAQQLVEKKGWQGHDYARTGRMAFYGTVICRPIVSTWYKFIQNKIVFRNKNVEMVTKVATDQTLFAPASIALCLSTLSVMEGSSAKDKLKTAYPATLKQNWTVWPFVQLFNFRFVPLEQRVLVVSFFLIGWNCYLSYLNSSSSSRREQRRYRLGRRGKAGYRLVARTPWSEVRYM
ncbi:hypothetical protein QBC43DRAFT_362037 [Cladorrhinum sp. PSN259]|nr:hypothetical protein QBC43DRAFT_362037 [Cladorrhinum sp. PSN259]